MTKEEARNQAIAMIVGQLVQPGTIVGVVPITAASKGMKFLRYHGAHAVLRRVDSARDYYVAGRLIVDVNKVVNVANHLLNLGFWHEGMESKVIQFGKG